MKRRNNLALYNAQREARIIVREIGYDEKYLTMIDTCKSIEEVSRVLTFARCAED